MVRSQERSRSQSPAIARGSPMTGPSGTAGPQQVSRPESSSSTSRREPGYSQSRSPVRRSPSAGPPDMGQGRHDGTRHTPRHLTPSTPSHNHPCVPMFPLLDRVRVRQRLQRQGQGQGLQRQVFLDRVGVMLEFQRGLPHYLMIQYSLSASDRQVLPASSRIR